MTNNLPPRPSYQPTPGLVTTQWHTPRPPAAAVPMPLHQAAPIPVLPDNHQSTVNWERVRGFFRAVITPATVTGTALSPIWVRFAGLPLAAEHGLRTVVGGAFLAVLLVGIAHGLGYSTRAVTTVLLVAIGTGTLALAPYSALMES
jgi:hypothetical protein